MSNETTSGAQRADALAGFHATQQGDDDMNEQKTIILARHKRENFEKMERHPWNGTDALYSQSDDWYFFDRDALDQYCEEHETTPESLRLIICVPIYAKGIDPVEYYHDDLPDDKDEKIPDEIWEACRELPGIRVCKGRLRINDRLKEGKVILLWYPGKYAASLVDKKGE